MKAFTIMLGLGAATVAMTMATAASAQTAAPVAAQAADAPAAEDAPSNEILVTARKRNESLADIPLAVSALTADGLSERGVTNTTQLNDFVPGFRVLPAPGSNTARTFSSFVMRGMNPNTLHPDRQNVGVFIDGISIGGAGMVPGLNNVERVEVVKGPQSAYFGRATFGGAVNYVTKAPSLTDYSGGVDVTVSSRGSTDQRLYVEAPIIADRLSVRVDGQREVFKSGYKNYGYGGDLGDQKSKSYSVTVLAKPIDALSIRGFFTEWENNDGPNATEYLTPAYRNCNPAGAAAITYFCGGYGGQSASTIAQNTTVSASVLATLKSRDEVLGDDFPAELGLKRLAHFGYINGDLDLPHGFTLSGYYAFHRSRYQSVIDAGQRYDDQSRYSVSLTSWDIDNDIAEMRLASDVNRPLKVMVGVNYFRQNTFADSIVYRNNVFTTSLAPQGQNTKTYGVFGSVSYDITDRLSVSAEARQQQDKIETYVINGISLSGKTNSFSPRAIIDYKLTRDLTTYVSYSQGTRPSQFNTSVYSLSAADQAAVLGQSSVPKLVPEEKIKMTEIGLRGDLFDRRVTILADAYYGWWRDRQAQSTITYNRASDNALTSVIAILPNGKVDVYGAEVELTVRPTDRLTLDGSFAYNETEIKYSVCPECVGINGIRNNVDNRLPGYAAVTGSAGATYTVPISNDWEGFGRVDYVYTGRMYETEANAAYLKPGHRVNARIGAHNDLYRVELFAINLFDSKTPLGISRATDTYNGASTLAFAPAPRRTVGVRLALEFK
jgi:iron complex outermembrane receptor protein